MRHLKPWDYKMMPWKNGQGSTLELVIDPPEAGLSGAPFNWRLSIADVAVSGAFSRYPGYERRIMLIDGKGMTLNAGFDGLYELTPFKPVAFSGDWNVTGRLTEGPVRDFNLMFARRKFKGTLETIDIAKALTLSADGGVAAFHLVRGAAKDIAEGDTLIMQHDETVEIAAATEGAIGIIARLQTTTRF